MSGDGSAFAGHDIAGRFRLDETHQYVRGWIYDRHRPSESQWVDILVGDHVIASVEANLPRGDLRYLDTGYTRYGFEFLFPDWPPDTHGTAPVTVRHRDSGTALRSATPDFRQRSIRCETLAGCELDDLRCYEVGNDTRVTTIDSNGWMGDPAYKDPLLGLHLARENRQAKLQQTADGQWQYEKAVRHFRFPNATVIMPFGIVIVDGHVVLPSLVLLNRALVSPVFSPRPLAGAEHPTPQHHPAEGWPAVRQFDLRTVDASVEEIDQPALLMSTPGYQGYYHWHVDVLPLVSSLGSTTHNNPRIILCAQGESAWQRDSMELVRQRFGQCEYRFYGELKILKVRELLYSSGLGGRGAFLSPGLVPFYEALAAPYADAAVPEGIGRRLYLSRRAQARRTMSNEAHIEALASAHGFSVINPAQYSYQQQIALFRQADSIISPHGAGLTNLLFCRAGVNVIELFGDAYINRSLQRVANLKQARYAYLVGKSTTAKRAAPGRHAFSYDIPPAELEALIKRSGA